MCDSKAEGGQRCQYAIVDGVKVHIPNPNPSKFARASAAEKLRMRQQWYVQRSELVPVESVTHLRKLNSNMKHRAKQRGLPYQDLIEGASTSQLESELKNGTLGKRWENVDITDNPFLIPKQKPSTRPVKDESKPVKVKAPKASRGTTGQGGNHSSNKATQEAFKAVQMSQAEQRLQEFAAFSEKFLPANNRYFEDYEIAAVVDDFYSNDKQARTALTSDADSMLALFDSHMLPYDAGRDARKYDRVIRANKVTNSLSSAELADITSKRDSAREVYKEQQRLTA